jgi:hypothetical protein
VKALQLTHLLFTPQQQVAQQPNMTTVANDTNRIPLQAMMTLLFQPLAMLLTTVTKLIFSLLLAVGVEGQMLLEAEAEREAIGHRLARRVEVERLNPT